MERYSNIFKSSSLASLGLLLILTVMILAQNLSMCNALEDDLTSQNQFLNSDYSSEGTNLPQHSLAVHNETNSDDDIIDYNDVHKVYKLFSTALIHTANVCLEVEPNSNELKSLNSFSNNSNPQEKTILLHFILI